MNGAPEGTQAFDVLIVGSGPSGAQAAVEAASSGASVGLVDIGHSDDRYDRLIPDCSFSEIRRTDPDQRRYFLGDDEEVVLRRQGKAGVHLTPAREHMIRDSEKLLPLSSETFFPIQSTALGGLAVSWGANAFTYEDFELRRVGLPVDEMRTFYAEVARDVGVSGSVSDDLAPLIANLSPVQSPLEIDANARDILAKFARSRERFLSTGFYLGQSLLAVLTQPLGSRSPNRYHDLDFYSDHGESVYRPRFTIRSLASSANFRHLSRRLALRFEETRNEPVRLVCRNLDSGRVETLAGRRLVLAAGAINSARLTLRSLGAFGTKIPILCNPNIWVATLNLAMLGRAAQDRRYSLAQLTALQRVSDDPQDYVLGQFYSYRSLLLYRLLRDIPLPPELGVLFLRSMLTALTLVNVHFSDTPGKDRWLELRPDGDADVLHAHYVRGKEEEARQRRNERLFLRQLIRLGCVPLGITRPAHGASIHYAGTLPGGEDERPFTCDSRGRLRGAAHVWVADASTWNFLPSKGLTLTLMANARRVARETIRDLRAHG